MLAYKSILFHLLLGWISSIASGDDLSDVVQLDRNLQKIETGRYGRPYENRNCTCEDNCDSHENGDPHFRMWGNGYYDFQSSCDMIHVRNSILDLHIRTKYRGGFSAVSRTALRYISDIMEIIDDGTILLNGAVTATPFNIDGIYPVTSTVTGSITKVIVTMSGAQSITFTAVGRGGINIYIDGHGSDFCDSQGMAGTWQLDGWIKRDGITPVSPLSPFLNKIEYGVEWEVDSGLGDPILFSTPATDSCIDPPTCDPLDPYFGSCFRRRNLQEESRNLQSASTVCLGIIQQLEDLDNCIFDYGIDPTLATNNPAYLVPWRQTNRCIDTNFTDATTGQPGRTCEDLGGKCVWRCDPSVSKCKPGIPCKKNAPLEILPDDPNGGDYIDDCSCAIPRETKEPTPSPTVAETAAPTDCPQTGGYPAIAGYLPRSDATQCLAWDLIQKELEGIMSDESCASLADGEDYYNNGLGQYFQTIPEYAVESTVYKEYTKYYNKDDFLQIWIEKAFQQSKTNFARGNANFGNVFPNDTTGAGTCVGFEEVVKKATAYTGQLVNSYQYVQKAIDSVLGGCYAQDDGCTDAIEAIDCAVSAYVGSLEGTEGNNDPAGDYGKGPYALADKRCRNYHKCGPTKDSFARDDTSPVNAQIMSLFAAASHAAWLGDADLLEIYLRLISNKSVIPLIQGSFRYYYRLSDEENGPNTFSTFDKYLGEGGAFMFGALPKLWACSKKGESRAYQQSKLGYGGPAGNAAVNFQTIKLAFECNYRCLGIRCEEVGALYDDDTATSPKIGAEACDDEANGSEDVCDKPKKSRKQACKQYTGKPGINGRDKLKFTF